MAVFQLLVVILYKLSSATTNNRENQATEE
jgi:hypothetical protein